MSALVALVLLAAQPASQPASKPGGGGLAYGGTGKDVTAGAIIQIDLDEGAITVKESWELSNESGKAVAPEHLVWEIGAARLLRVDEDVPGFKARDDSSGVEATSTLGAGKKTASFAYLRDVSGSGTTLKRSVPVNLGTAMIILPAIDGLRISANHPIKDRIRDMNGRRFLIYDLANIPAGSMLEMEVEGVPTHSAIPRFLATAALVLVIVWMFFALRQGQERRRETVLGAMSAEARRDRIVKAIELLERDFRNDAIKERRYQRRHEELMGELATVLREIGLAS